jgi:DNA-binding transcriptional LysR family regulator
MYYTLHQLQIFHAIARTGSVTRAAEELHLTQPAVSIQLKNLQNQFEIPLTEVVGRKIYVTDFGKEIATAAEAILAQVESINHKTLAYRGQLAGRLKISVVSTGKYVMPYFLSGFLKQHPGVELVMDVTNKSKVIDSLAGNEVDFSLVSVIPETLSVNKIDLLENKLFLVGHKTRKIAKLTELKTLFEKAPLIFRENGSGTRQAMERFIDKHHVSVRKKMELTSNEAVKQAVMAGLGYSIMPIIGIRDELAKGVIKIIPVKGLPIKTMWSLIWLKGKNHSPAAAAFLHYLNENKESLMNEWFAEVV